MAWICALFCLMFLGLSVRCTDNTGDKLVPMVTELQAQQKQITQRLDSMKQQFSSDLSAIKDNTGNIVAELSIMKRIMEGFEASVAAINQKMVTSSTYNAVVQNQQDQLYEHTRQLNQLAQCSCSKAGDRVFFLKHPDGHYKFTLAEAQQACQESGASLASPQQLEEAWKQGFDMCACGWLSDGSAKFPTRWARKGCGSRSGISDCGKPKLADVYCYYHKI